MNVFIVTGERTWDKGELDLVWVTDFTYLPCGEGWVYLVVIRDAHSPRVIGYAMSQAQTTQTVIDAMKMVIARCGRVPAKIVLHADRGAQFTSREMKDFMIKIGGHMSMGPTGVCWDNAMAQSFWATLKVEYYYRHTFRIREEIYESLST